MNLRRTMPLVLVTFALFVSACASGDPLTRSADSTPVTRRPLSDPPDPGPPPLTDGLTTKTRDRLITSTVWVSGLACGREREGSGFAVEPDLIATAAHVIVGIDTITVTLVDGRILEAVPVLFDTIDDLALLRTAGADLTPLPLGGAPDGTIGTLIGWRDDPRPDPTPFRIDRPVTVEITEVAGTDVVERPSWLLAANVESGDSGAALIDDRGVVVGIAYATTRRNAGVAYAVRATSLAEKLTNDLSAVAEVAGC